MVKRKASATSDSDSVEAITGNKSKIRKKMNYLVQSASLSSKDHLLQKVLANSSLPSFSNKSVTGGDDSEPENRNVKKKGVNMSPKMKKRKKEAVSCSDETSGEDKKKLPVRLHKIKQEKQSDGSSSEAEASLPDSKIKPTSRSERKYVVSEKQSDGSSSEAEESLPDSKIKPTSRAGGKYVVSPNREEYSDVSDNMKIGTTTAMKHMKKEVRSAGSESSIEENRNFAYAGGKHIDEASSSENEENNIAVRNIKLETTSTRGAGSSDEEIDRRMSLGEDEQLVQRIEEKRTPIMPPRSKVTVLQNIRFAPKDVPPIELLKASYPGLQPLQSNVDLEFSDSEDVHLLRIPKNVDPKLLKKLHIDLKTECKIDIGEKYSVKPTSKTPDPTLVVSSGCRVVNFKSNIRIKKYIKSKREPHIVIPDKQPVALPDILKKRHPLFGSDFEQKIKLTEQVEQKLDEAIASILKKEKKAKKRKKKSEAVKMDEKREEIFNLFDSHTFINGPRARERSEDSAFGSSSSLDKPRKSEQANTSIAVDTLTNIKMEPSDNDVSQKRKKKVRTRDKLSSQSLKKEEPEEDLVTEATPVQKNRNKRSIINSTLIPDINTPKFNPEVSNIFSDATCSQKKPKKYRNRSLEESRTINTGTLIADMNTSKFNPEVSDIFSEVTCLQKKPKKYRNRSLEESKIINTGTPDINIPKFNPKISDIFSEATCSQKKPKKYRQRSLEESKMISDILNTITSDLTPAKKAHKKHKFSSQSSF